MKIELYPEEELKVTPAYKSVTDGSPPIPSYRVGEAEQQPLPMFQRAEMGTKKTIGWHICFYGKKKTLTDGSIRHRTKGIRRHVYMQINPQTFRAEPYSDYEEAVAALESLEIVHTEEPEGFMAPSVIERLEELDGSTLTERKRREILQGVF